MSLNTVDLTNMMRGEGEWKNMQEVVRRTLKICFEQMERQGEQVAHLAGQVASLKTQLASKANRDEIGTLAPAASRTSSSVVAPSKEYVTRAELDKVKERVANLQNDLERKASVRYVDECLQRKVDRSDMLVKNLATFSAAQYASQLTQLYQDVTDTKASVEALSRATSDMQRDMQGAEEFHVIKNQMEAIYRSMGDYYTKNHVQALLNQKQDVSGLDAVLQGKADHGALQAHTVRIEAALESHERAITALRLKLNDTSLFDARETLARNSAQPLFVGSEGPCRARRCVRKHKGNKRSGSRPADGNASSGYDSSASTGSCKCNNAEVGGGRSSTTSNTAVNSSNRERRDRIERHDISSVLRDGRVQALIEGLWTKVDNAEVTAQRVRQELEGHRSTMSRVEATLSQVAGAAQMETLGLVVEEQRRRIDSILTGSAPIESITEEFIRQQADIAEIQSFLALPQHKPLRDQLGEAGELMSVLSDRVAELGTALGRAGLRLEAVEVINRQLETRVQMAEHGREKVQHLHNVMDLAGTEYGSLKDIAKRLSGVCAVILGPDGSTNTAMAALSHKHPSVVSRVQSLETDTARAEQQLRQLEARLRELKQIVSTGFTTSAFSQDRSTAASDVPAVFSRSSSGAASGSSGGGGRFSPQSRSYGANFPVSTSPARRGAASHHQHSAGPGLVVGGDHAASPLRSPSPLPSPIRSPDRASSPRRVSFPAAEDFGDCDGGGGGVNDSRVSVDFEQALEQMLTSIHQDSTLPVPVQDAPSRRGGAVPMMAATMGSVYSGGGGGAGTTRGGGVTVRTASLQSVDERLAELKCEKERLRRLLMHRVETL